MTMIARTAVQDLLEAVGWRHQGFASAECSFLQACTGQTTRVRPALIHLRIVAHAMECPAY